MKAIAYLETETVLVEDTAAHTSAATAAEDPKGEADVITADTARVAAENQRMRAELAEG